MAGNRCDSCAKMVALTFEDPEVEDESVTNDGVVHASVALKRNCEECGGEMKSATLDLDATLDNVCKAEGEGHELSVEIELSGTDQGGGRYAKRLLGAEGTITVTCLCGVKAEAPWSDSVAAGDFDDV